MKTLREYKNKIHYSFFDSELFQQMEQQSKIIHDLWEEQRPNHHYDFPSHRLLTESADIIEIPLLKKESVEEKARVFFDRRTHSLAEFDCQWSKDEVFKWMNLSFGVSGEKEIPYLNKNGEPAHKTLKLRTYPSGGSMLPIELYLYLKDIEGLEEGLYKYHGDDHLIQRLKGKSALEQLEELSPITNLELEYPFSFKSTKILTFMVANYQWVFAKYGLLSKRLATIEAGHIGQNIQLAATILQKKSLPMCGFYEDKVEEFLEIDHRECRCIYMVALG
ncbi:SagB/ThcOx family dehydrogenase [Bacillus mesophilum]|uniref:SagB/ThcOx family dehydrogenase n=1 Tax=Bacillus mesophilum TaxID=1071718 RepID=A0A7V7UTA9_9BACI|nr:SagB/ThcOx family dehydrogenase [Bacillus mesophilum]KAB2330055.1 SagB/ThcOx family dehydrogenase [Bacillus mesophilum]